jgi:hypothetical protein
VIEFIGVLTIAFFGAMIAFAVVDRVFTSLIRKRRSSEQRAGDEPV